VHKSILPRYKYIKAGYKEVNQAVEKISPPYEKYNWFSVPSSRDLNFPFFPRKETDGSP